MLATFPGIQPSVGAGTITIKSKKSIRFSDAAPYRVGLNAIALPWLIWWMSTVIVGGLTLAVAGVK